MAFYLNAEVCGQQAHEEIMQYHWKEWAGTTRTSDARGSWHSKFGAALGTMTSSVALPGTSESAGDFFGDIIARTAQQILAREGFSCHSEPVFIDAKADRIFAAVRVDSLKMEGHHGGCCLLPLHILEAAFCECPPRPCGVCDLPVNIGSIAKKVEDKLQNDYEVSPINADVRAQYDYMEKLQLHQMGYYVTELPDCEDETEIVIAPVKIASADHGFR